MLEAFADKYPETIKVSQDRIGISSRSTLATYMGIMDDIRAVLAKEILSLTVEDSLNYLKKPKIIKKVTTLKEVGLDYLTLGLHVKDNAKLLDLF